MLTVAIDWSGARDRAEQRIWLAEIGGNGAESSLRRLENGRDRGEMERELLRLAEQDTDLLVGLDFSFSFPAWFVRELGCADIDDFWGSVETQAQTWLAECPAPFWGRPGRAQLVAPDLRFRETELDLMAKGWRVGSAFQIGGAGSVGTSTLRGVGMLRRLRANGFSVWPFDDAVGPTLVELWPRIAVGAGVVKTSAHIRHRRLQEIHDGRIDEVLLDRAAESDDAFDALMAARYLHDSRFDWPQRPRARRATRLLEGEIWLRE